MTRAILIVFLTLTIVGISHPQVKTLLEFEAKMANKIKVGMSTNEVKRAIGNPKSVEGGFPNSTESIVSDLPEQVGQLNSSTWFYIYKLISIKESDDSTYYYINGMSIDENIFGAYDGMDSVLECEGRIVTDNDFIVKTDYKLNNISVPPDIYEQYRAIDSIALKGGDVLPWNSRMYYRPSEIRIVQKDPATCWVRTDTTDWNGRTLHPSWKPIDLKTTCTRTKHRVKIVRFRPVFCVIFDRGTEVVAASRMYFQLIP